MIEQKPRTEGLLVAVISLLALIAFLFLHFRNPEIFRRELIDYDDETYILPIRALSFSEYFGTWMRNPENFAFPLRDLTFFLDFAIQKKTGIATFWITNALLFIASFAVFYRIFRESLGHFRGLALALVLWVAFHPALVEMVQWASNRKHLLVGLFLAFASHRVLRLARASEYPSEKEWVAFFVAYIAAWFCWPSASLWIFAVLFIFRKKMHKDPQAGARIITALVIGVGAIAWTFFSHQTFSGSAAQTTGSAGLQRIPIFGLASLGRGIFSYFWPYSPGFAGQEPYYRLEHPAGLIGLGLFLIVGIIGIWRYRSLPVATRQPARDALILAAALFVPQAMTFLTYVEFVWADRYLYLPAPYLTLGLALLAFPPPVNTKLKIIVPPPREWQRVVLAAFALFALASALVGTQTVPRWTSSVKLFSECHRTERSPKCLILEANQVFDDSGCAGLPFLFGTARELSAEGKKPFEFMFRTQFPLYESICIAQYDLPAPQRAEAFAEIYRIYESPQYAVFGEVLALLRSGNFPGAFARAYDTYLGNQFMFPDLFPKAGNLLRAQANALCELAHLRGETQLSEDCRRRTGILEQLTANATPNEAQYQWGFHQSIEAFNRGKMLEKTQPKKTKKRKQTSSLIRDLHDNIS